MEEFFIEIAERDRVRQAEVRQDISRVRRPLEDYERVSLRRDRENVGSLV
jgi:predicted DNA-binding protein YlxM (UPF0122 family)